MSSNLLANLQKLWKRRIKPKPSERSEHEAISAKEHTETLAPPSPISQNWLMPIEGQAISLADVPDSVFSSGIMGAGFAIQPNGGQVISPVAGKITALFPTKHAIVIETTEGLEILIHVGIDTVNLKGEGFTALVESGATVNSGTPLLTVDWTTVKKKATSSITPIIFTNLTDGQQIAIQSEKPVIVG